MDREPRAGLGNVFHRAIAPPCAIDSHDISVDAMFENHAMALATIGRVHVQRARTMGDDSKLITLRVGVLNRFRKGRKCAPGRRMKPTANKLGLFTAIVTDQRPASGLVFRGRRLSGSFPTAKRTSGRFLDSGNGW